VGKEACMSHTISLLNMKGGVGKTTLAVNLAWYMYQRQRHDVLLVDLDPQFNATQYVMDYSVFDKHRREKGTIADLLIDQPRLDLRLKKIKADPNGTLHTVRRTSSHRFDLLPSELSLAWVVKNPAQMEYRLEKLLHNLSRRYDYVFIDCAPTDSVLTTMALTASDFILVPVRPDRFSVLGFTNLLETVEVFRKNCPDPHEVRELGVVFTQVMGASKVETDCMNEISSVAKGQNNYVFGSSLGYSQSFIRALKDQTPIFQTLYAHSRSKNAASHIAEEMQERIRFLTSNQESK
jgi:chromosome partitioning protein